MDELWAPPSEDESADVDSFTDSFGNDIAVTLAPIPPPSMNARGMSGSNTSKLLAHVGEKTWASKGGDIPSVDNFDNDRVRAVDSFALKGRERFQRVVDWRRCEHIQVNLARYVHNH